MTNLLPSLPREPLRDRILYATKLLSIHGLLSEKELSSVHRRWRRQNNYLAIGPRCWARGPSPEEAIVNMKKYGGFRANKKVPLKVYKVHQNTFVDGMGAMSYPRRHSPKLVMER